MSARRPRPARALRHATEYIAADTRLCEACGDCVEACRKEVLSVRGPSFHKHVRMDHPEDCRGCGKCVSACSHGALVLCEQVGASVQHVAPASSRGVSDSAVLRRPTSKR